VTAERGDGSKAEPFGNDPRGVIVFTPEGYFSLLQSRRELPKIAANDRAKATPEEATAIVEGSIAYYGTYSVNEADKTIAVKIEQTSLTADELKFTNPRTPAGVTLLTAWKRAQAR
jgi:hypothetical protein